MIKHFKYDVVVKKKTSFCLFPMYCGRCMLMYWLVKVPKKKVISSYYGHCPKCEGLLWQSKKDAVERNYL